MLVVHLFIYLVHIRQKTGHYSIHFAEYFFHLLRPHLSAVCKQQNMKNNVKLKIYKSNDAFVLSVCAAHAKYIE